MSEWRWSQEDAKLTSWHLSQTARNLPESLGPTGRGVSHHAHVVAHVSEVLRQCDSCRNKRYSSALKYSNMCRRLKIIFWVFFSQIPV